MRPIHNKRLRTAFETGKAAYLVGITLTPPGKDDEWLNVYWRGYRHQARKIKLLQRCRGCSGCIVDKEIEEYRRLMRRPIAKYHKPRHLLHITPGHWTATGRGKRPDHSTRMVEWVVVDGKRVKKYPTVKERWAKHRESQSFSVQKPESVLAISHEVAVDMMARMRATRRWGR